MLIEFKVSNYRSFLDEQTFSLVANRRDKTHRDNLIECEKFSLLKSAAVYGANASGKSNLIAALDVMKRFVLTSATEMTLDDPIEFVTPFRLELLSRGKPSRFEIAVFLDGTTYVYGFSASRRQVHDEWLFVRRDGGRISQWLDRRFDPRTTGSHWRLAGPLRADAELLKSKTRTNCLLLSRGAELNITALSPLFLWFRNKMLLYDLSLAPTRLIGGLARKIQESEGLRAEVLRIVRDADFGITGIDTEEQPAWRKVLKSGISPNERRLLEASKKLASIYFGEMTDVSVVTEHTDATTGRPVRFRLEEDESKGTQRFFALAGPVLKALDDGDLLVVDELDCSMHPLLTRKIIEMFHSPELNKKGAQLVFATHDSSVMDSSLFRRDQIWLTEKRQNGATDLYSLHDFETSAKPRKGEALEKRYLAGRYGAIPNFGPTLEDLQIR